MRQKTEDLTLEPYNPLTEIYGALGAHVQKNKWLIAPLLWNEWPQLTAEAIEQGEIEEDVAVDFLDNPLINQDTQEEYGGILAFVSLNPDGENYFMRVDAAPTVTPDHELYFEPVAYEIDSQTGKIMFIIEPLAVQPLYIEGQKNHRISMSFHIHDNETYPRWHTYKRPFDLGNDSDENEEENESDINETKAKLEMIDPVISDAELTSMFIKSAAIGCLPGFESGDELHAHFAPDHFDQSTPYPKIWSKS